MNISPLMYLGAFLVYYLVDDSIDNTIDQYFFGIARSEIFLVWRHYGDTDPCFFNLESFIRWTLWRSINDADPSI